MFPWLWIWYQYWEEQRRQQQQQGGGSPAPGGGSPAPGPLGVFRWSHRDGDFVDAMIAAVDTAKRGTWRSLKKAQLVRQVRALGVASLHLATLVPEPTQLGVLGPWLYSTPERNAAASAIARTFAMFAPDRLRATQDMVTDESAPATSHFEVGLGPVAVVALGCVAALSAAFLGTVALAGGIVALLANLDDLKNSETAKAHWWLLPVVVMGIGYMLRKRHSPYGTAVLAVGGALFAIAYQIQSKQAQAQQQQPPQQPAQPFAPQFRNDVQGPAFPAFPPPNFANLLPAGGGTMIDVPMPDGTVMKVPVLAAIAAALRQRNGAPRPAPVAA